MHEGNTVFLTIEIQMLLVENITGLFERTPLNESTRSKNWMKGRKDEVDERKDESWVKKQEGHFLYLDLLTSVFRNKGSNCSSQNCLQGLCSPFGDIFKK